MRLSFKQIEYFRAVMEAGTVSAAAELLHVSQPNVSRMLKYTESRLKLILFERMHGRLLPTPEAYALFREIQALHLHLESLQEAVDRIANGEYGRFPVGSSPSLGRHVVPSLLTTLRSELHGLPVKLDILSVSQVIDYLIYGQGECACTIFPIKDPRIRSEAFSTGALLCALPHDHPLNSRRVLTATDLACESLVGFEGATPHGQVVTEFFAQAGLTPKISCTVRFAESACAMVEQGSGLTLVDEFTLSGNAFPRLRSLPVTFRRPFRIYFHRAESRPLSKAGLRLRELLRSWK